MGGSDASSPARIDGNLPFSSPRVASFAGRRNILRGMAGLSGSRTPLACCLPEPHGPQLSTRL
jgi:hypothetical protein